MKNILYVELSSGFGGSSEALYNLLKYINKSEYTPIVLITRNGKNFEKIRDLGIQVLLVPFISLNVKPTDNKIASYFKTTTNLFLDLTVNSCRIQSIIKQKNIDIIHINTNIKNNLQAIFAAKLKNIPCVCHIRDTRPLLKLEGICRNLLSKIIVLTKESYDLTTKGFKPDKVIIIPDGHDLNINVQQSALEAIKKEFNLFNFICVGILGRLVEGKGQDDFIHAASIILKQKNNVKFLIVGNNPDPDDHFEKDLRLLSRKLSLENNLIFTGWRNDKNEIISVLDVVVQASSTFPEGFGLTCIEAMALRKPVIATNIPGPNSIVVNNLTGFIVPPGNPEELSLAIKKFIDNPGLSTQMGIAGRKRVEEFFDIQQIALLIQNLYKTF